MKSLSLTSEPALEQIRQLGARLRAARVARRLRQVDVCAKVGLSRSTLEAVERGEPTTAMGAYVALLWLYGLNRELDILADPGLDRQGLALQYSLENRRVRVAAADAADDDF
ncbi:MAG: helix-turn-helix domain-containing protein [Burkholderiales bacterium]